MVSLARPFRSALPYLKGRVNLPPGLAERLRVWRRPANEDILVVDPTPTGGTHIWRARLPLREIARLPAAGRYIPADGVVADKVIGAISMLLVVFILTLVWTIQPPRWVLSSLTDNLFYKIAPVIVVVPVVAALVTKHKILLVVEEVFALYVGITLWFIGRLPYNPHYYILAFVLLLFTGPPWALMGWHVVGKAKAPKPVGFYRRIVNKKEEVEFEPVVPKNIDQVSSSEHAIVTATPQMLLQISKQLPTQMQYTARNEENEKTRLVSLIVLAIAMGCLIVYMVVLSRQS